MSISAQHKGFRPVDFFHSFLPLTNLAATLRNAKKGHEGTLCKMQQCVVQMMKEQECKQIHGDLREVELNIKYVKGTLVSRNTHQICEQIADLERVVWKILDFVRGYFDQSVDEFENAFELTSFIIDRSRELDSESIIRIMCQSRTNECYYAMSAGFFSKTRIMRINVNLHKHVLDNERAKSQDRRQRTLLQDHIMRGEYQQALLILKLGADPNTTICSGIYETNVLSETYSVTKSVENILPPLFLACVMHEQDRRAGKKLVHIIELIIGLLNAGAKICETHPYDLGMLLRFNLCWDYSNPVILRSDFFIPVCELLISLMHNSDFIHFRDGRGESLLLMARDLNVRSAFDYLLSKGTVVLQTDINRARNRRSWNTEEEQANEKIAHELESIRNRQIDEYMRTNGQMPRLPLSLVKVCEVDKTFIRALHEVAKEIGSSGERRYLVISDDGKLGFCTKKSAEPSFEKLAACVNRKLDSLTNEELKTVKVALSKIGDKMRQAEQAQLNVSSDLLRAIGTFLPIQDRNSFRIVCKFWKESIDKVVALRALT